MMAELEEIIAYALSKLKGTIEGGTSLYDNVEERLEIALLALYHCNTKRVLFFAGWHLQRY